MSYKRKEKLTQCMPGIAGTKEPSTTAPEAVRTQQNGMDKASPASQHMPLGAGTASTQVALLSRQQYDISAQDLICG